MDVQMCSQTCSYSEGHVVEIAAIVGLQGMLTNVINPPRLFDCTHIKCNQTHTLQGPVPLPQGHTQ